MSNPTEQEIADAYQREFPGCLLTASMRVFMTAIHVARSRGVGFGWMRQVVGLAWKLADPYGCIDDERIVALHDADITARLRDHAFYREVCRSGPLMSESALRWLADYIESGAYRGPIVAEEKR